jgi:hypothetical protein
LESRAAAMPSNHAQQPLFPPALFESIAVQVVSGHGR